MTQAEAGEALGWTQQTVQYYCKKASLPRRHVLDHMCVRLDLCMLDLTTTDWPEGDEVVPKSAIGEKANKTKMVKSAAASSHGIADSEFKHAVVIRETGAVYGDVMVKVLARLKTRWRTVKDRRLLELAIRATFDQDAAAVIKWLDEDDR